MSGICHRHLEVAGKTFLLVQVGRQKINSWELTPRTTPLTKEFPLVFFEIRKFAKKKINALATGYLKGSLELAVF